MLCSTDQTLMPLSDTSKPAGASEIGTPDGDGCAAEGRIWVTFTTAWGRSINEAATLLGSTMMTVSENGCRAFSFKVSHYLWQRAPVVRSAASSGSNSIKRQVESDTCEVGKRASCSLLTESPEEAGRMIVLNEPYTSSRKYIYIYISEGNNREDNRKKHY